MKITVTLTIDEDTLLAESGQENLEAAINQELGWLHDSGLFVDQWTFDENEQQKAKNEASALSGKIADAEARIPNLNSDCSPQTKAQERE